MSQKVLVAIEEVEGLGDRLLEVKRKVRSLPAQLTAPSVLPPFRSEQGVARECQPHVRSDRGVLCS